MPQQSDDGSSGHVYTCPRDKYCHAYFEVSLSWLSVDRFELSDIDMIRTIESLLLDALNGKPVQISDDINILKTSNTGILKVGNVRTMAYVISENHIIQGLLSISSFTSVYSHCISESCLNW